MADVTFRVRGDSQRSLLGSRLVAEVAIRLLAVGQFVFDVRFVLFGIEESVEVLPRGKIALRRAGRQTLAMADGAGLKRARSELCDVAFDAGFMSRELDLEAFVTLSRRHQRLDGRARRAALVAGLALQLARLIGAGDFDHARMGFVSEVAVIFRFLPGAAHGQRCGGRGA